METLSTDFSHASRFHHTYQSVYRKLCSQRVVYTTWVLQKTSAETVVSKT